MLTGVLSQPPIHSSGSTATSRQPVPPADRVALPKPLSAIVMKLLAKNAEDRYQTAAGLEYDLRQCRAAWEQRGGIEDFPLAAHDVPDQFWIHEKLYGRSREVAVHYSAPFELVVATGAPELVLVSGFSGVGKSSLVNELHKVLVPPRGLFAFGKFDQYKRGISLRHGGAGLSTAHPAAPRQKRG